jgi:ABC-2 type transport system permease protein
MTTATIADVQAARPPARSPLPRALLWKAWNDARWLLASLVLLNVAFQVIYVWLASQVDLRTFTLMMRLIPASLEKLVGFPLEVFTTPTGRMAMAYVHPVTTSAAAAWAIARGSDCVSGEIGRGTMEMLLAQPVRRWAVIVTHGLVTTAGALVLAAVAWVGTWLGIRGMGYQDQVSASSFIPSALNLFGFIFFLAAVSTLVSAFGSDRRRTIGIMCGFYLVQLLFRLVSGPVAWLWWLEYLSFFGAYWPELLSVHPNTAWTEVLKYDAALIGFGLLAYAGAIARFNRRDLPAPL